MQPVAERGGSDQALLRLVRSLPRREFDFHIAVPGPSPLADEFWAWRVTYPTGRFDPAWVAAAARQNEKLPRGLPATAVQVPCEPATSQASHWPSHAVLQQKPSAQVPLWH